MTNSDVVKKWVANCRKPDTYNEYLAAASLHASHKYLYSYLTPIAKFENGKFYLTSVKYSHTTSMHQNLVKNFAKPEELVIVNEPIKENYNEIRRLLS